MLTRYCFIKSLLGLSKRGLMKSYWEFSVGGFVKRSPSGYSLQSRYHGVRYKGIFDSSKAYCGLIKLFEMYQILGGLVYIRNWSQNCFKEAKRKWCALQSPEFVLATSVYIVEDLLMLDSMSLSSHLFSKV